MNSIGSVLAVAVLAPVLICGGMGQSSDTPGQSGMPEAQILNSADYEAQKLSVTNINKLSLVVKHYIKENGNPPVNLSDLARGEPPYIKPDVAEDLIRDGWRRPIYYSTNGRDFVLLCFGKDGIPVAPNLRLTHGSSAHGDYDADMVMINGTWAQSPGDFGKH